MPQNPTDKGSAAEERLREAMRAAEARSAEDQAALERVRRKLTKLMLVSLIITFFTLAVVVVVGIYKWTHPARRAETAAAAAPTAQLTPEQEAALARLRGALIQTAPNSGADAYFARQKQEAAAKATAAAAEPAAAPAANQAAAETATQNYAVPLAAGERLVNANISGNMLLLQIEGGQSGSHLLLYDLAKGQIRARIQLSPAAPAGSESGK